MVFIFGVLFIVAGLALFIITFVKSRRPQAEAIVNEVFMDYYEKDKNKLKKHPHGLISYVYRSIDYQAKIFLLRRKVVPGDRVTVSFKEEQPDKPVMYAPRNETLAGIVLVSIGAVLIGISIWVMDHFQLW